VVEVLRRQPREIILTALARMAEQGPFYVFAAFLFTYGTTVLHSSRDLLLTGLLVGTGLSAVTIPLSGHISDRIGRRPAYLMCSTVSVSATALLPDYGTHLRRAAGSGDARGRGSSAGRLSLR